MPTFPFLRKNTRLEQIREAYRLEARFKRGFIEEWRAPTSDDAPIVVFIPGFLQAFGVGAGRDIRHGLGTWRRSFRNAASSASAGCYVLHWPSPTIRSSLAEIAREFSSPDLRQAASSGAFVLERLVPGVGQVAVAASVASTLSKIVEKGHDEWKHAVRAADKTADSVKKVLEREFESRPVVLVGHSLGGRIALRAAEAWPRNLHSVIAMAPAVRQHSVDWRRVAQGAEFGTEVLWSRHDWILNTMFHVGQMTAEHAVGVRGVPAEHHGVVTDTEVSEIQTKWIGHMSYEPYLEHILRESRVWQALINT